MRVFHGAGHEQFTPGELLANAGLAEQAGFDGVAFSDHFQPWRRRASRGKHGPGSAPSARRPRAWQSERAVTPAVARYHPLVAQAFATLEPLFPGRAFLGAGNDEFRAKAIISDDPDEHVEQLREVIALGATTLAVMNCSGADPEGTIRSCREHVLPRLKT